MAKANYNRTSEEINAEIRRGGSDPTSGSLRIAPGSDRPVDQVEVLKYARKIMGNGNDDGRRLRG